MKEAVVWSEVKNKKLIKMIMETITVTIIMKTLKAGNNIKTRHREKKQTIVVLKVLINLKIIIMVIINITRV